MKGVVVLGSTGSIGRQALDVIRRLPESFRVVGLAAWRNVTAILEQAAEFHPEVVCVGDEHALGAGARPPAGVDLQAGDDAMEELAAHPGADVVVMAIGGFAGLRSCLAAARAGKRIAMASKEPLVSAGEIIFRTVRAFDSEIIPVDSEHSAIFQCIEGRRSRPARLILTASGGPFRTLPRDALSRVTPEQALKHPNWRMGPKVTVDSATLMNKGLEVIEAHVLFGAPYEAIDVVVHPQSIIHSMVEMNDGSVLAQMAPPDMRLPIQYALTYPERVHGSRGLGLPSTPALTFEAPDVERFPALRLGYEAGKAGGTMPAVMSAADEVAVARFLSGGIGFTEIPRVIEDVMCAHAAVANPDLATIYEVDAWARTEAARVSDLIAGRSERS
ncbi:MAG: 1-deoxy-D-xylulose-5-phosphate reductoisomerase [Ignavibacteriales bacterium]